MPEHFHERFNISLTTAEAKRRFVNRARNELLTYSARWNHRRGSDYFDAVSRKVATIIGEPVVTDTSAFQKYTKGWDFYETLRTLEALNAVIPDYAGPKISGFLAASELDLDVRWDRHHFMPSGAELLDERLVNDCLQWARERGYETVSDPFEKALAHLLRGKTNPELLPDVVTDAYEAVEAVAKVVTGRDATLDANREAFISKVKASEAYKRILKEYLGFAHRFRHGLSAPGDRPTLTYAETESFVYMTGVFLRLAMSAGFEASTSA
jgi:hypothetical protein